MNLKYKKNLRLFENLLFCFKINYFSVILIIRIKGIFYKNDFINFTKLIQKIKSEKKTIIFIFIIFLNIDYASIYKYKRCFVKLLNV